MKSIEKRNQQIVRAALKRQYRRRYCGPHMGEDGKRPIKANERAFWIWFFEQAQNQRRWREMYNRKAPFRMSEGDVTHQGITPKMHRKYLSKAHARSIGYNPLP